MRFYTRITMPAFVLLLIVAGCKVGSTGHDLGPARTGQGLTIQVTVPSASQNYYHLWKHHAEVLDVQADSLLLRSRHEAQRSLFRIAYRDIDEARFDDLSRLNFDHDGPSPDQREALRLLSRFPQGVDDNLLRRLLDAYNQNTLRTVP
jgi:hypothetical protein